MIEFIDKTSTVTGTPISRETLMAIQGFITNEITFDDNGDIIETNSKGQIKQTSFGSDGSIVETFKGDKTITKTTTFTENKILEVIS